MTDKITIVTYPDDYLQNGHRILFVDLDNAQKEMLSRSLLYSHSDDNLICYSYQDSEDVSWVIDKSIKSQLIVVNADSQNQTLIGYLLSKSNCYYVGNLKGLNSIIDKVIHDSDQFIDILNKIFR